MKEIISLKVIDGADGNEMEVQFIFDDDVIEVRDVGRGKVLFSGDWSENFAKFFDRALEIWPTKVN